MADRISPTEAIAPKRMTIVNLTTGTMIEAQYNPNSWDYKGKAIFNNHEIPGLSNEPSSYDHTKNAEIPLSLLLTAEDTKEKAVLDYQKNWLLSLLYIPTPMHHRPPRVLFSWANEASITCQVHEVTFGHKRFNVKLNIVEIQVELKLVQVHDAKIYGSDILIGGMKFPSQP